jgi:hypothetical protein
MMKTNAQRQRDYRAKRRSGFKRVELFLPIADADRLKQQAEQFGITQSACVSRSLRLAEGVGDCDPHPPYSVGGEALPSNVTGNDSYDGTTALASEVADLISCSPKSRNKISKIMQEAKAALNITTKSTRLPADLNLKLYRHIRDKYD